MNRHFISELIKWKNARGRKPLILNGARQVGKEYSKDNFPISKCFSH